ncbi:MAG: type II toxin-antitoxin system HipA family toxin YjjJ [Verrucomicrobiota bacterium]
MPHYEPLLEFEFRRRGALSAAEIAAALKISQPTASRLLSRVGRQIVRLGRGKLTSYAMARNIPPLGNAWPLYEIDAAGKPHRVGLLNALQPKLWALQQENPWETLRGNAFPLGLYPDFPWFLDDLRPQGFLGRAFAKSYGPALGLSPDPRLWNADQVAASLIRHGHDLPGSFVIGEAMLAIAQERMFDDRGMVPARSRAMHYPALADAALANEWPGSSAGGEQPKFTARIKDDNGSVRHVIVKFSGRLDRPEGRRWADLLIAEHLAATLLNQNGIPAACTKLVESDGRFFLESERFDRIESIGRCGLVSLLALDAAYFCEPYTPWTAAAGRLREEGWITEEDAARLTLLWWFGELIANADMHFGNVSLFLTPHRPLALAPVYDMLPMAYRPGSEGQLPEKPFSPPPPPPEAMPFWTAAVALAEQFWARLSQEPRVSAEFKSISARNSEVLVAYRRRFT